MHQNHLSNKDSKPEIIVTHSNDTTDLQLVTPPQADTAEKSTLKPNETKSSENDNDEDTHAAAQRNLNINLKHAIQLDSVKHRSV